MPKKGKPSHRKGLSGNPRRRAAQLQSPAALLELARPQPEPWWAGSHERILTRTRSLAWPSDPGGIEELTCEVVGDELHDREPGFDFTGWLRQLITAAGTAAREASGTVDGRSLWALQRGLALITPSEPPVVGLSDIGDPRDIARAEVAKTAAMLDETWVHDAQLAGARLVGEPQLARDVYGSRFLLTAPFAYSADGKADHWYAWDIDVCWLGRALYAGPFTSGEAALEDWRDAVGSAATDAGLAPCPRDLMPGLLRPLLADGNEGGEPRPMVREHYRMRRRARDIATLPGTVEIVDPDRMVEEFSTWYESRHGETPRPVREAADIIADQWGPVQSVPDERVSRGCSPHRIRQTATLIRDTRVLTLLPEWTQWCIDSTGLTGEPAQRALQTAAAAASPRPARRAPEDEGPWRVRE